MNQTDSPQPNDIEASRSMRGSTATQANLLGQLYTGLSSIRDLALQCSATAGKCLGESQAEDIAAISLKADGMIARTMAEWDKLRQ
jgi:hypothetical protein